MGWLDVVLCLVTMADGSVNEFTLPNVYSIHVPYKSEILEVRGFDTVTVYKGHLWESFECKLSPGPHPDPPALVGVEVVEAQ